MAVFLGVFIVLTAPYYGTGAGALRAQAPYGRKFWRATTTDKVMLGLAQYSRLLCPTITTPSWLVRPASPRATRRPPTASATAVDRAGMQPCAHDVTCARMSTLTVSTERKVYKNFFRNLYFFVTDMESERRDANDIYKIKNVVFVVQLMGTIDLLQHVENLSLTLQSVNHGSSRTR